MEQLMFSFESPLLLLLAIPLLYLLWSIQNRSYADLSPSTRIVSSVLRSIIILLLVAAAAGPQIRTKVRQNQVLFLVDLSESILPDQRETAREWINQAVQTIHSPDQAGIIVFGTNAEVERFPTAPFAVEAFESRIDSHSTNYREALRLAESLFAGNYQRNLVLLSDGLENEEDSEEAFQDLRSRGASTQAVYLKPAETVEALVDIVRVPEQIHLQESFGLEAVVSSNRKMPALLQIFRNGTLLQEASIVLDGSKKQLFRFPEKIAAPGLYRFEARLKAVEDTRTENNIQESWVLVEGPPRLLIVDESPGEVEMLARIFRSHGFVVDIKAPRYVPRNLQELMIYQAILIRNVPASMIHDQMPILSEYVHDFGGGFAMLGGKKSFGPGGYYQTPVETILPVRMDLINKKYLADVAIVIVIDKSGSMSYAEGGKQKIDLADEGGSRVASLLKSSDQLGVLAVDSVAKWAYSLQRLGDRQSAIDAITSIRAGGGGIYVYSGLKEAYRVLTDVEATVKHVILFADTADCEEKEGTGGESSVYLAQKALEDHQITTTTIGIGQPGDVDISFLENTATLGGGRFYFTSDMHTLPEIFTQESSLVQRFYITEETFSPEIANRDPLLLNIDSLPDLHGYVATSPKSLAGIGILSQRKDPILAYWRHGLGQSIAFTSDPVGEWSRSWHQWPDFQAFWTQVARYLTRAPGITGFHTSFGRKKNGNTAVMVDVLEGPDSSFSDGTFQGAVSDSAGNVHQLHFIQTTPGRYEAEVPGTGKLFGKIFYVQDGRIAEEEVIHYEGTARREHEITDKGKEHLRRLAERIVESPGDLQFSITSAEDIQSLTRRILFWCVFLFLLDIAIRKIEIRRIRIRTPAAAVAVGAPSESLKRLRVRKEAMSGGLFPDQVEMEGTPDFSEISEIEPTEGADSQEPENDYMQRLKAARKRGR